MNRKLFLVLPVSIFIVLLCIYLTLFDSVPDPVPYLSTSIIFRNGQRTPMIPAANTTCYICQNVGWGQLSRVRHYYLLLWRMGFWESCCDPSILTSSLEMVFTGWGTCEFLAVALQGPTWACNPLWLDLFLDHWKKRMSSLWDDNPLALTWIMMERWEIVIIYLNPFLYSKNFHLSRCSSLN